VDRLLARRNPQRVTRKGALDLTVAKLASSLLNRQVVHHAEVPRQTPWAYAGEIRSSKLDNVFPGRERL